MDIIQEFEQTVKRERELFNLIGGQPLDHLKEYEEYKQVVNKRCGLAQKIIDSGQDIPDI